jgi:hypothetical protein
MAAYERLASQLIVGERTPEQVMAELRARHSNLNTLRNSIYSLRKQLIMKNIFHPRYVDAMNAWGDALDTMDRRDQLVAFAAKPLAEQLRLQKRCRMYDQTVFTDVRDACFITSLKIAPDYFDAIRLTDAEIQQFNAIRSRRLEEASSSVVSVSAMPILEWARAQLVVEDSNYTLAIALAIITGRRMVELIVKGSFQAHDATHVVFTGQAKEGLHGRDSYVIPVLARPDHVMAAHERLLLAFEGTTPRQMNSRHCNALNELVRSTIHPDLHFHALRVMYTLVTFEAFRPHTCSINAWAKQVLGHMSMMPSLAYTKMDVVDAGAVRGYAARLANGEV